MKPWLLGCAFLLAASTTSAQAPPNDSCAGAINLACGQQPNPITTNTTLASNDYDQAEVCTGNASQGPDIAYRVVLPPGGTFQANLNNQTYDSSLYLIQDCSNAAGTCVAGADNFPFPGIETFSYTNTGICNETLFLIVDGVNPTDLGLAELTYSLTCSTPPPTGACCQPDGSCSIASACDCATTGGTYQGDNTDCDPNPCGPRGACCDCGDCSIVTAAQCQANGLGVYQGDGTVCSPNPCPQETGACCYYSPLGGGWQCWLTCRTTCQAVPGNYLGDGTSCTPSPCPVEPTGACCYSDICEIETGYDCVRFGGDYQGDGTVCDSFSCTGACCFQDNCGPGYSAQDCYKAGGVYWGNGSGCDPNPCGTSPYGACCLPGAGGCTVTTEDDCLAQNGFFSGEGTTCPSGCSTAVEPSTWGRIKNAYKDPD